MEDYDKEHVNDLWEDMDRLNSLYEELMWEHDDVLEFVPDYKNNQIIIKNKQHNRPPRLHADAGGFFFKQKSSYEIASCLVFS